MKALAAVKKKLRVVALAHFEWPWRNAELVKDCGLIPYLLYKNHGCEAVMACAAGEDYPYLEKYVPGLQIETFAKGDALKARYDYFTANAANIDWLFLRGIYPLNCFAAEIYKQANPNGKICLALDANSQWMDRLWWYSSDAQEILNAADIITNSSRKVAEWLSVKWGGREIITILNGFYNVVGDDYKFDFAGKQNIIMTVGRLGTFQKNTELLLDAFQLANLKDWKLVLVGGVETDFQETLKNRIAALPAGQVVYAGSISDKKELYALYRKAKIFALTSRWEGGTPNVIGEALNAGCAIATTEIDAGNEACDDGHCGIMTPIEEVAPFAAALAKLANDKNLEKICQRAFSYGKRDFDMEKITAALYQKMCEEERK